MFTSVCINTAIYLPWLYGQCLKNGAVAKRGVVSHVSQAADLHHSGKRADIVINATGLGSLKLGGVEDADVYPARGQTVLVRNEAKLMVTTSGTEDAADEANYIMQRAAGEIFKFHAFRIISLTCRIRRWLYSWRLSSIQ